MTFPPALIATYDQDLLEFFAERNGEDINGWNLTLLTSMQMTRDMKRYCENMERRLEEAKRE